MQVNATPQYDMSYNPTGCCPKFNPKGWDNQFITFQDKRFVRATSRALMHVPLNMGRVFSRVQAHIEEADALEPDNLLVLSRSVSASQDEHLFAVTKDVPNEEMASLSGTFLTRVFEGPYRHAGEWMHALEVAARANGKKPGQQYLFYTTCPRCARTYGENYVVGFVELLETGKA